MTIGAGRLAAVVAVCVALGTSLVAGAPRAVGDSASPLTIVMVSPSTNIVDGQPVEVGVTGLDLETTGTIAECGTAAGASSVTCLNTTNFNTDDSTVIVDAVIARSSLCQGPADDSGCYVEVTGTADGQPATVDWPIPSVGPDFVPPIAQGLQVADVSPDQIIISWDARMVKESDNIFLWAVTRTGGTSTDGGPPTATFVNPPYPGADLEYFNWGGLLPDTQYTVTLAAQDWDGESAGTLSATVTTPSPDQSVTVDAARRSLEAGASLRLHGAVRPGRAKSLDVQQWRGGAWHSHRLRTNKHGRYATTMRAVSGTTRVRVVALAKHGYRRAMSRVIHLHIRR
jgi:hypothetical protein